MQSNLRTSVGATRHNGTKPSPREHLNEVKNLLKLNTLVCPLPLA